MTVSDHIEADREVRAARVRRLEALRLLGVYTAGRFDFWMLSGNPRGSSRRHIMSYLDPARKGTPGVNEIRGRFLEWAEVGGNCDAERYARFVEWARAQLAGGAAIEVSGDPAQVAAAEAQRARLQFGSRGRNVDSGRKPITDSPLFGGEAQGQLF